VIYDSTLTVASADQLHIALSNRGYINNEVTYRVKADTAKKKAIVNYDIRLNEPYYIRSIAYNIPNDTLKQVILADSSHFNVHVGDLLDYSQLDSWRQNITNNLRNHGYFAFNKEYITFTADTAANSQAVDITLNTMQPYHMERMPYYTEHRPFYVRKVTYVTDYDPVAMHNGYFGVDTLRAGPINVFVSDNNYLRTDVISECNFLEPGKRYSAENVNRTYRALGRLSVLKLVNIDIKPVGEIDGKIWIDAYVLLQPDKTQSLSLSLEGTNSEGDLGFGVGVDYEHRNLFKGSEVLSGQFKLSYESLSGNLSG